jgi:hypothetical protein
MAERVARTQVEQPGAGLQAPPAVASPMVRELLAYWDRLRAHRLAPAWSEIDPGAIRGLLPYLIVSEVLREPFDIRFRIVGTAVIESFGYDFTWQTLSSMRYLTQAESWVDFYRRIVEQPQPTFGQYRIEARHASDRRVDSCTLPLSRDGRSVDRFIELEDWSMAGGLRAVQAEGRSWRFAPLDPSLG